MEAVTNRRTLDPVQERDFAEKYWAIKNAGAVVALCREFGISKPTGLKIAARFEEQFRKARAESEEEVA